MKIVNKYPINCESFHRKRSLYINKENSSYRLNRSRALFDFGVSRSGRFREFDYSKMNQLCIIVSFFDFDGRNKIIYGLQTARITCCSYPFKSYKNKCLN